MSRAKEVLIFTRKNRWGSVDTLRVDYRKGKLHSVFESTTGPMSNAGYLWYHNWNRDLKRDFRELAAWVRKDYKFNLTMVRR